MRKHWMDRLAAWRNQPRPNDKPYDTTGTLDHALNLSGMGGTLKPAQLTAVLRPGRAVTKVDWRGCMAEVRHVDGVGVVLGLSRYAKHGYENRPLLHHNILGPVYGEPRGTLGVDIDYNKPGATWVDFSRLRFIGKWPYQLEEWA